MTCPKIIAGSPSNKWHLILKLLEVFYCKVVVQFVGDMPYLCIFVEEVVALLREMTDKLVLTFVSGRN